MARLPLLFLVVCPIVTSCVIPHSDNSKAPPFTNGASTLAGGANPGYVDGDRDVARFSNPVNVAYGPDGNLYVADFDNNKIRAVAEDGTTSTVVAQKGFGKPFGLAFSGSTLYVTTDADMTGTHIPMKTGSVWTVDISAKKATILANAIGMPRGIVALKGGGLAVADYENHVIETINTSTGAVTVIAGAHGAPGYVDGAGATARFSTPYGLVQRSDGKLIVCDYGNNRLRLVGLDGTTQTLAGSGAAGFADGAMTAAMFDHPEAVAIDSASNLYVADVFNYRVRRIKATTQAIDTIAGNGNAGYLDDDDPLQSEMYGLEGISVRPDGSMVYVADGNRGEAVPFNRVRQVKMDK